MKTKLVIFILTAGISALSAQSENRERGARPNPAAIFDRADANGDEFLDLKELTELRATIQQGPGGNRGRPNAGNQEETADNAAPPPAPADDQRGPGGRGARQMPSAEEMLASMDKNEDGKIARDEFNMGNRRGRGGQGGGEGQRAKKPE
jgi:hypothetical protein